jgi:hypothetical protein
VRISRISDVKNYRYHLTANTWIIHLLDQTVSVENALKLSLTVPPFCRSLFPISSPKASRSRPMIVHQLDPW